MYLKTIISFAILFTESISCSITQMMLLKSLNSLGPHKISKFPLFNINLGICLIPVEQNKGMSHIKIKCFTIQKNHIPVTQRLKRFTLTLKDIYG